MMHDQDPPHPDVFPLGFVDLLARILSDPSALDQLQSQPEEFFDEFHLTPAERQAVLALDQHSLNAQANILFEKRWHEIKKLIPLTLQNSDQNLKDAFDFYATKFWPTDYRRHLADAFKFLQFLEQNEIAIPHKSEKRNLKRALK